MEDNEGLILLNPNMQMMVPSNGDSILVSNELFHQSDCRKPIEVFMNVHITHEYS